MSMPTQRTHPNNTQAHWLFLTYLIFSPVASKDMSESETESDVLFESKSKTTSFATRMMNGEASHNNYKKNGHYKGSRKVKT